MRRFWQSTFGLSATVSIVFALATAIIGLLVYDVAHEALEEQLDHRVAIETQALLALPGGYRLDMLAAAIERREAARSTSSLDYILVDAAGRRIAGSLDAEVPAKTGYEEFLYHGAGHRIAQALATRLPDGGMLVVAADRAIIDETDVMILRVFAAAFGATLLLGALAAWTIGAVTRHRLERIDRAAQAIIDGDFGRRMPIDASGSEFDRLSATLNEMLDRIGALMDNLRQVSSDVAHDLRTPLTRLKNRLEEAQADGATHDRDAAIAAASQQAEELLEIFGALLRISEVEAMGVREQFRPIPLGRVIDELLDTYRPDAEASGHALQAQVAPDILIDGDRRLLQQMVSNLLDNALRHTPAGTRITITLDTSDDGEVTLTVADDGPGVPATDRTRLFQRFSRSERSRSSDGHGLGLALVAAIAAAHHGASDIPEQAGFAVRIRFSRRAGPIDGR